MELSRHVGGQAGLGRDVDISAITTAELTQQRAILGVPSRPTPNNVEAASVTHPDGKADEEDPVMVRVVLPVEDVERPERAHQAYGMHRCIPPGRDLYRE